MSVQVPKGYKQTEVGVIPEDWNLKTFGQVLSICHGKSQREVEVEDGPYPILASGGKIGTAKLPLYEYDSVLIGRKGTINKPQFMSSPFWTVDTLFYSRINSGNCAKFIYYLFCSIDWMQHNEASGVPSLNARTIEAIQRGYPLNPEQQAIADALSDADALIESLEQLIDKKRQIKQGAMQELLTGQRRLPGFSGEWEKISFNDLVGLRKKRFNPQIDGQHDFCIELEHINQSEGTLNGFTSVKEQSSLKTYFYKDDILFGKLRAYLKKYWKSNCNGVCSTEIWVFFAKKEKIISEFLIHIFQMDEFIEAASSSYGTHMPRSDWNIVKKIPVTIPDIKEQFAISEILGDMDREIFSLNQQLDKVRQIKQSMMQELLTGRIRLL